MTVTTAIEVAGYLATKGRVPSWDSMKLQKLVYFAQAWNLAWTARPLFDEDFQAWSNGPVVRSVYAKNKYGVLPAEVELSDEVKETLDSVLAFYGDRGYEELIQLTHDDAPWLEARRGLPGGAPSRKVVSQKTMLDFYSCMALEGGDIPRRTARPVQADSAEVAAAARRIIERWSAGLALLAHK
ncbi:Panacea domain-containing protein [Rathayibacter sp. AY1B8]|uniref:Panacea domain-containing protein n=1 Tax=Rathayibacter sp. AY1B8 TaxID=2080533 RepID=UPI000CE88D07|nr:type II toxin-antitoxin system antitoxin SocA domain-containing protein [Rathayibacter sp. AY1B8]PPI08211.1 hypothetical protein C5C63_04460 [Rathayibacter sp. AY1B8]